MIRQANGWKVGLRRLILAGCIVAVAMATSSASAAALKAGAGKYTYHDPVAKAPVEVFYYLPEQATADSPVVFVLHGIKRNAADYRDGWIDAAKKYGLIVLAPHFSRASYRGANGYNLGNVFKAVTHAEAVGRAIPQNLNPPDRWSFSLIGRLFKDFRTTHDTTSATKYYIYGHGAGGQFVSRMMMFEPRTSVALAVAASAGWYTVPDRSVNWPYGIGKVPVHDLDDAKLDAFYQAPLVVMIGTKDTRTKNTIMRKNAKTAVQGNNRLARARYFFDFGKHEAATAKVPFNWTLQVVPGVGHRVADMVPAAARLIAEHAGKSEPHTVH